MSTDADTYIRDGIARSLKLETIIDAARALLAEHSSSATGAPAVSIDAAETKLWCESPAAEDTEQTLLRPSALGPGRTGGPICPGEL